MKRILIAAGLSGMLVPALASAELDYNAFNFGFVTKTDSTSSNSVTSSFTEYNLGISKSIRKNIYLDAYYETGTPPWTQANMGKHVHSISFGPGFHTPLKENIDIVASGHIVQGTDKIPGSIASANGYDIGAGLRSQFPYGLEGSVLAVHESYSSDTVSNRDTYVNAQFGFNFTPDVQMYGSIDLLRTYRTIDFGLRLFY